MIVKKINAFYWIIYSALSLCPLFSFPQKANKLSDANKIRTYTSKLNKQAIADGNPTLHFTGGVVNYAPDKSFKIFSFKGEDCNMHCNCVYVNKIVVANNKKLITLEIEFPINKIFKMSDGKYLLLQKAYSCDGRIENQAVTLMSLKNDKPVFYVIDYNDPVSRKPVDRSGDSNSLQFFQYYQLDLKSYKPLVLNYEPKTNRLNYRYQYDMNQCCGKDEVYTYTGYFTYANGQFVQGKERREKAN